MEEQKLLNLSKTISHALRHDPEYYGLMLDEYGWVKLSDLVHALENKSSERLNVQMKDVLLVVEKSKKKRHEIVGDRIRALYGHSTPQKIIKYKKSPPTFLYHGTCVERLEHIFSCGLLSMKRQYVHLSEDTETAEIVAKRHNEEIKVLIILALDAYNYGINFYKEESKIWLSEPIPSLFIKF